MAERIRLLLAVAATLLVIAACNSPLGPSVAVPTPLVVLTHDAFAISDAVMAKFESQHNVDVQILKGGDAGEMVNKAILTKDVPLADVLYGVDNTFLSRALEAGIFEDYASPALPAVPETLRSDTKGAVTPIDYGDVCLNYDKKRFGDNLPAPDSLEDMADGRYKGMLVVENPATSSPGLAFLLSTIGRFTGPGDSTWQSYWAALRDNDVLVVNDWDTAYYTSFSGGAGEGDRPIVVSYATSPVAEVVFADPPVAEAPTGVITDGCFRQVEYAGVLKGTKEPELARAFIDFMLSPDFQSDIPLNMYVFPANNAATIPEVFSDNAAEVTDAITLDPAEIAANREQWVQEWTDVVLR
ncbi:MAG: thiamine ABC transporter substrate-binding protein [Chloroflexota bacterium]